MDLDLLCRLPLFSGVPQQDLDWLFGTASQVQIAAGQVLMREGEPGGALYIVLEGEFEFTKRSGSREVTIAMGGEGEVIGEMSLLDQAPRSATARATRDSRLLKIEQDAFRQLLASSPSATMAILHTVTTRLRNTEAMLRQNEKMAALGTLSAGLAHELNNPAAAGARSAAQLRDALGRWQELYGQLARQCDVPQMELVDRLRAEIAQRAKSPVVMDTLVRSDRESALEAWLEDRGVEGAWEIAPALVSSGWDLPSLQPLENKFGPDQLTALVCWLSAGSQVYTLSGEIAMSAERISEIVKAVKSYSYLDQAPIQQVDVHEGLENTLVILRYKLKQNIRVTREYDPDLPLIDAFGSELNQVWTNIIDNAIDALQGGGELTLRTYRQDGRVLIEIGDNGPGIPADIQSRIFEPFFTTKPPGVGSGLGLHISYNIVQKHHGQIQVTSQPGATVFRVTLPMDQAAR